jgi:hypothetical protein
LLVLGGGERFGFSTRFGGGEAVTLWTGGAGRSGTMIFSLTILSLTLTSLTTGSLASLLTATTLGSPLVVLMILPGLLDL